MCKLLVLLVLSFTFFSHAQIPTSNFTANPLVVCLGVPVNFNNTSTPNGLSTIVSNAWDFGDGALSMQVSPSHTFTTAGTFTVTLVVTNSNGTVDAEIKTGYITVNPLPIVAFSINGLGCTVPLTLAFVNSSSSGANFSYAWNFGNSQNASVANPPNITYNSAGSYTINLNVTNTITSCMASSSQNIQVANFQAGINAPTYGCVGQPISFQDNSTAGANSWSWNFGGQGASSSENPSFAFNAPGTYTVQLTSQNTSSGCTSTITQTITIQANTNPIFSANPTSNCAPGLIQFTSSTTIPGTYVWNFGDGQIHTGVTPPPHIYTQSGFYDVTLSLLTAAGCTGSTTLYDYINITNVEAGFFALDTAGCDPLVVQFIDTSFTPSNPIVSWEWNFGNGNTYNGPIPPNQTYPIGVYNVQLIITTQSGCKDTIIKYGYVTVGHIDSVYFTNAPLIACSNDDVIFTSSTYISVPHNANEVTYFWDFGDGTSIDQNPTHQFESDTGYFDVTFIADFRGCKDTFTVENAVYILAPIAQFSPSAFLFCNPNSFPVNVAINDNSIHGLLADNVAMHYEFSDGSPNVNFSNAQLDVLNGGNTNHAFSGYGSYNIEQVIHNYTTGCSDSINSTINISQLDGQFTLSNDTVCNGTAITVADISTSWSNGNMSHPIVEWYYNTGNGPILFGPNQTYTYSAPGNYTISLSVLNSVGCTATETKQVKVVNKPIAGLSTDQNNGCSPFTVAFTNTSFSTPTGLPISSFNTSFSDDNSILTTTNINQPINHTFIDVGTYSATIVATDVFGCTSFPMQVFITITKPTVAFEIDSVFCDLDTNQTLNFSSGNGPLTHEWFLNGSSINSTTNTGVTLTNPQNGQLSNSHILTLVTTDANGCKDTLNRTLIMSTPLAIPNFFFTGAVPNANGEYDCPPIFCNFQDSSFSYGDITSWNWSFGNGNNSILQNPSNTLVTNGTFDLNFIVTDEFGCTDDSTVLDYISIGGPMGTPNWLQDATICAQGAQFYLSNISNIDSLVWSLGDGTIYSDSLNFNYIYATPGTYQPSVTIFDSIGCQILLSLNPITVNDDDLDAFFVPNPVYADINGVIDFMDQSTFTNSPIVSWTWNLDGNSSFTWNTNTAPTTSFAQGGPHVITLTVVDQLGCVSYYETTVFVSDPDIWIPNVFSPNSDGVNDFVVLPYPAFKSYDISIFNRWGNLIKILEDQTGVAVWDGLSTDGKPHTDGVYFYLLNGVMLGGTKVKKQGFITLIRGD
jgi:gliding motility-associated-like protein